jgi:hypothetical protein
MCTRPMVYLTHYPTFDSDGNITSIIELAIYTPKLALGQPEQVIKSSQPSIVKSYLSVPQDSISRMSPVEI